MANDGNEPQAQGTTVSTSFSSYIAPRLSSPRTQLIDCQYRKLEEKKSAATSAPSGIAQLRKSVDHSNEQHSDPMNLDDFLMPNSIASPAGITPFPDERSSAAERAHPSAMPIQSRKVTSHQSAESLPVSSVPQPSIVSNRNGEFDYVRRRLRKTSIDERRVSHMPHSLALLLAAIDCYDSLENDLQSSLLTFPRRHYRVSPKMQTWILGCLITPWTNNLAIHLTLSTATPIHRFLFSSTRITSTMTLSSHLQGRTSRTLPSRQVNHHSSPTDHFPTSSILHRWPPP